jgi:hypothetical protein
MNRDAAFWIESLVLGLASIGCHPATPEWERGTWIPCRSGFRSGVQERSSS